jgi:hypothetical protein
VRLRRFGVALAALLVALAPTAPAAAQGEQPGVVATGGAHSCAITGAGDLYCWGDDKYGQLGDGARAHAFAQPVPVLGGMTEVAAGRAHTCALDAGGRVYCWGDGSFGQLGVPGTIGSTTPLYVRLPGPATHLAAGGDASCATVRGGHSYCWGAGLGSEPRAVDAVPAIDVDGAHGCAAGARHSVYCWGAGDEGQLGAGNMVMSAVPVRVQQLPQEAGGGPLLPVTRILQPVAATDGLPLTEVRPVALISIGTMLVAAGLAALLVRPGSRVRTASREPRHGTRRPPASAAPGDTPDSSSST